MSRNSAILMASAIALMGGGAFGPGPVYKVDTNGPLLYSWPSGIPYHGGKTRSSSRSWGTIRRHASKMRRRMA
jgi:hypothetical protein